MQIRDVMTPNPVCCRPDTPLPDVASMMVEHDCGEIPVIDLRGRPIGVVTDRDICCRTVARRLNPLLMRASDCMSAPCITVTTAASMEDCVRVLETNMIRRVLVIDESGRCCGIVSQADVAQRADVEITAELLQTVSRPVEAETTG
jgi:CBS domain-containing protein